MCCVLTRPGKRCLRCWRNKLKHGNKLKKENGGSVRVSEKEILQKDVSMKEKKKIFERFTYYCAYDKDEYTIDAKPWNIKYKQKNHNYIRICHYEDYIVINNIILFLREN